MSVRQTSDLPTTHPHGKKPMQQSDMQSEKSEDPHFFLFPETRKANDAETSELGQLSQVNLAAGASKF